MGRAARRALLALSALLLLTQPIAEAQLSKPHASDSQIDEKGSKFLSRSASADVRIGTGQM